MDVELSLGALEAFYQQHDPTKLDTVDEIYEKYPAYKACAPLEDSFVQIYSLPTRNSNAESTESHLRAMPMARHEV